MKAFKIINMENESKKLTGDDVKNAIKVLNAPVEEFEMKMRAAQFGYGNPKVYVKGILHCGGNGISTAIN